MARDDAETLRRRLYAPGAAVDDVDRYRRAGGGREALQERAPRPPRRQGPRRRTVVIVAVAVVAALVVAGIGFSWSVADPRPTEPAPTPLAIEGEARTAFVQNLVDGNGAGIAAWLLTTPRLPRFSGSSRFDTVEEWGAGDGVVTLAPVEAAALSGRASVFLVLDRPGRAGWTALRRSVDGSGEELYVPQVRRAASLQAGELTVHTYRYAIGDRPVQLRIDAPDGVRWGVAVVFSD